MPDNLRTVTTFSQPIDAELAKNRLEAQGIPAYLMGEESVNLFNMGGAFGTIQLQVTADQWQRAVDILESATEITEGPLPRK